MSDFIRKSEAIKAIMEDDVCCYCSHTRVLREIKNLPSIEPNGVQKALCEQAYKEGQLSKMPKRGKWVEVCDTSRICSIIRNSCSECGEEWLPEFTKRFNFCPYCGADMRQAENEDEKL